MNTEATVAEARRLWHAVGRDNLMIKVPATKAGLPAIRQLIGEGINVNITLLFSQHVYEEVAEAYLAGVEHLVAQGGDASKIASVASVFVSRIDVAVDKLIEQQLGRTNDIGKRQALTGLRGKVAIANAKLAYQRYKTLFAGARWDKLRAKGARVQRLLWASTSTKNKAYSDVLYVEELIAPDTVNTIPPETMDAFRDHGKVAIEPRGEYRSGEAGDGGAGGVRHLDRHGDGKAGRRGRAAVRRRVRQAARRRGPQARGEPWREARQPDVQTARPSLKRRSRPRSKSWRHDGNVRRLWAGDASLWTGSDEAKWLGWLNIVEEQRKRIGASRGLAEDIRQQDFTHIVLLGMGGSSLGPEVFAETFKRQDGCAELLVLEFDRSGANPDDRKQDRSGQNAIHCIEQVRQHA